MPCYPRPLVDCANKMKQILKVENINTIPYMEFFHLNKNEFSTTASAAAKIRASTIYDIVKLLIQIHLCCSKFHLVYYRFISHVLLSHKVILIE